MNNLPKPRNTLVLVRELKREEEKIGSIVLPSASNDSGLYMTAEIMAIGPGMATNGRDETETHDLAVGQRVFIKSATRRGPHATAPNGIQVLHNKRQLWLFEQTEVLTILDEDGEWDKDEDAGTGSDLILTN